MVSVESRPNDLTAELRDRSRRADLAARVTNTRRLAQLRRLIRYARRLADVADDTTLWHVIDRSIRWGNGPHSAADRVLAATCGISPIQLHTHFISIINYDGRAIKRTVSFMSRDGVETDIPIAITHFEASSDPDAAASMLIALADPRPDEARWHFQRLLDDLEMMADEADAVEGDIDFPNFVKPTRCVESIRSRLAMTDLKGTIDRPDFHQTTDMLATSDPLWNHLRTFRKWILAGGSRSVAQWHELLLDIRHAARELKLAPDYHPLQEVWHEAKQANELGHDDYTDADGAEWNDVVLVFADRGDVRYDLCAGFDEPGYGSSGEARRHLAAEWAEGWMRARERQLCGLPPLIINGAPSYGCMHDLCADNRDEPPTPHNESDDLRPTTWTHSALSRKINRDRKTLARYRDAASVTPRSGKNCPYTVGELDRIASAFAAKGEHQIAAILHKLAHEATG